MPSYGFVAVQANKGTVQYRNLEIADLSEESLFDGRSFNGWVAGSAGAEKFFTIADAAIVTRTSQSSSVWLHTTTSFPDSFVLSGECSLSRACNSGISFFAHSGDKGRVLEFQLLDNTDPNHVGVSANNRHGAFWGLAASQAPNAPLDQWQSFVIESNGSQLRAYLDGQLASSIDRSAIAANLMPIGADRNRGAIGLQAHSGEARFRNLRISTLKTN